MQKTIIGVKTVRGMAALWESGGNDGQRGVARLIAKADGSMPVSLFINYKEDNINGNQALVAVHKNFFVADGERGENQIVTIYRIKEISIEKEIKIVLSKFNRCFNGQWEEPLVHNLRFLADAVKQKLSALDCRQPYYVFAPYPPRRK